MAQIVYDNTLMVGYLFLWIITFFWYQYKAKDVDAGTAIILSYIGYAFISILTYNEPIPITKYLYEPLRLFPFIYLFVMLIIALSPAIYHHIYPTKEIEVPHTRVLFAIGIVSIICSIILIPSIVGNIQDGLIKLFLDNDAGKDAYEEQLKGAQDSGGAIRNIPAIIYNMLFDVSVFIAFYFLSLKNQTPIFVLLVFLSLIVGLLTPVMNGQRSVVILNTYTIIICYMLFRRYLSKRLNSIVKKLGTALLVAISLPIVFITISRFEGEKSAAVTDFLNWYIGQGNLYFNNHGLDAGGIRYGDRTINLAKRLIDPKTPKNFVERRDKYHNLELDDNVFSTFVGDFTIDFGPYLAVVIFIVFNGWVLMQIRTRGSTTIKLHQLLLIYFTVCICMQGGMYLFSYSDVGGNLRILVFALLYVYLKYHEVLLKKFPLYSKKDTI